MCKVYTNYCGTSEIENGLCACTVDNPLAKARGLSLRTGAQTMLYLSLVRRVNINHTNFQTFSNEIGEHSKSVCFPLLLCIYETTLLLYCCFTSTVSI